MINSFTKLWMNQNISSSFWLRAGCSFAFTNHIIIFHIITVSSSDTHLFILTPAYITSSLSLMAQPHSVSHSLMRGGECAASEALID